MTFTAAGLLETVMFGGNVLRLLFVWWFADSYLSLRCEAWRGLNFEKQQQYLDKRFSGDAIVTYTDVSAVTCAMRCANQYPCGSFAYSRAERTCTLCGLCGQFTLQHAPGYRLYVMAEEEDSSYDQPTLCPSNTVNPQKCWKQVTRSLTQVSVGPAGTWAVNGSYNIFYRTGTFTDPFSCGVTWKMTNGLLVQVDVGTNIVWGVNMYDDIFYRSGISSSVPDGLQWPFEGYYYLWVSVSPAGSVWAVNKNAELLHCKNCSNQHPAGDGWEVSATSMQRVDAGLAGVWALDTSGQLWYREGTQGDAGSAGTQWQAVQGTFISLAAGRDVLLTVDSAGRLWMRIGLGPHTPTGLAWLRYPGHLVQVDVFQSDQGLVLWGVDASNKVFCSLLND